MLGDTIAAVATGGAPAALGIVRISGPDAARVLAAVVPGARAAARPGRVCRGRAIDPASGRHLDEVLCFFRPGPGTATGEDVAEIHGHGGPVVLGAILAAALAAGARPARPGEFTRRAFLNGKIDLTQAEAVMGLVGARSERAARAALRQLEGGLAQRLAADYDALVAAAAELEARLDFPDEDLLAGDATALAASLGAVGARLDRLARSFADGARLAGGAVAALVGPANAGKSSLLNRLAGAERALVDAEPGTTRDVVEAELLLDGVPVRLADTAGLREPDGRVERLGIARAHAAAASADLLVVVLDGADPDGAPPALARLLAEIDAPARPVVVALNKRDLAGWRGDRVPAVLARAPRIATSARTGEGCAALAAAIGAALVSAEEEGELLLTTARQHGAIAAAAAGVRAAAGRLESGELPELAAAELRFAREALAALSGRAADADLLDAVFSAFCIGK